MRMECRPLEHSCPVLPLCPVTCHLSPSDIPARATPSPALSHVPLLEDVLGSPSSFDPPCPMPRHPKGCCRSPRRSLQARLQHCTTPEVTPPASVGSGSGLGEGQALGMRRFGSPALRLLVPCVTLHRSCATLHRSGRCGGRWLWPRQHRCGAAVLPAVALLALPTWPASSGCSVASVLPWFCCLRVNSH